MNEYARQVYQKALDELYETKRLSGRLDGWHTYKPTPHSPYTVRLNAKIEWWATPAHSPNFGDYWSAVGYVDCNDWISVAHLHTPTKSENLYAESPAELTKKLMEIKDPELRKAIPEIYGRHLSHQLH